MLSFLILGSCVWAALLPDPLPVTPKNLLGLRLEFQGWASALAKNFPTKQEFDLRFGNFLESKREIIRHNSSGSRFRKGLTVFADLTDAEFMAKFRPVRRPSPHNFMAKVVEGILNLGRKLGLTFGISEDEENFRGRRSHAVSHTGAPMVDWAAKGAVNAPIDQGECGGCYAFAAVAAVEGAHFIKTGRLEKFSEQFVINCGEESGIGHLRGCDGGNIPDVLSFFVHHGVHLFKDFPFTGQEDQCHISAPPFLKIKGMNDGFLNELGLTEELEKGPVGVAIEVTRDYRLYEKGIMDLKYPCGMFLNHGVLAVGYDSDPAGPFFRLRNSWGPQWGENGFFRVEMYGPGYGGFCGITEEGARPIL